LAYEMRANQAPFSGLDMRIWGFFQPDAAD